ncbi:MAG TPA: F0F1 ATP synthase subunit B' [Beijerinckiaceae bacterium]|nr:F0F1 ATP synthase subunit B' [Beijerinckiaceae bacterium]
MPQLDVSTFAPQLVWLAITFTALYVLMKRIGLPAAGAMIAQRSGRIGSDLDTAERLKAEAEAIIAAYELALAEARRLAQETLRQAVDKLNAEAAERQRETRQAMQEETAAAERRIAAARTTALADLRGVSIELARVAAHKLTGVDIAAKDADMAVDAILLERA